MSRKRTYGSLKSRSCVNLDHFFSKVSRAQECLLMLDYDGTLAPFNVDRTQSFLYPEIVSPLQKLLNTPKYRIILISGRGLEDLKMFIKDLQPLPELFGSHGIESLSKDGEYRAIPIASWTSLLPTAIEEIPKEHLEIKPFSIAFHTRGMKEEVRVELQPLIEKVWKPLAEKHPLELHYFDGGIEIRPKGINKGHAVKGVLDKLRPETPLAYLGDDATDEEAFAVIGNRGLKILIRKEDRQTLADIRLVPPKELAQFLERLGKI